MIPFIWSDQGKSIAEWIQHLCSISQSEKRCGADFYVYRNIEFDIPTLRNVFPKIGSIDIVFRQEEGANEHEILLAQNFLKAFLPDVQKLRLENVRLGEHFSIGDFGMTNLKELKIRFPRNLRVDDLLTGLKVWWETNTSPDLNVMLKGLKADEAEIEEGSIKFKIRNSHGVLAGIRSQRLELGAGGGGIGGSELMEVESEDRSWSRIGAGGGGIGGSELMEVESEDQSWSRWNRRIRADGGGIGGSELMEVESEDQSWSRWNRRIRADGGGIGGSELMEVESEDQSWSRWNRRIRADGGGIGGSELMEVESEDQS
ncbi:unnamed protein product [Caenorhabditis nigoni]